MTNTKQTTFEDGKVYSLFNASGKIEEIKAIPVLPLYCKVYCYGYGMSERQAAVISTQDKYGNYKIVYISEYEQGFANMGEHSRPHSKKFGIGTYYDDNLRTWDEETVKKYVALAEVAEAERKEQEEIKTKAANEYNEYLSKFKKADVRTTTNAIKRHILKTWLKVSEVKVRTEFYSMGCSMNVDYTAPEEIKELEGFIDSFQYGHFNGMEDIYEHSENRNENIIENQIMQSYKYVFCKFHQETEEQAQARILKEEKPKIYADELSEAKENDGLKYVDYSEKAFAIIGNTKPIKEQLKELGGRFNANLSCGIGWIFPKTKEAQVKNALAIK